MVDGGFLWNQYQAKGERYDRRERLPPPHDRTVNGGMDWHDLIQTLAKCAWQMFRTVISNGSSPAVSKVDGRVG